MKLKRILEAKLHSYNEYVHWVHDAIQRDKPGGEIKRFPCTEDIDQMVNAIAGVYGQPKYNKKESPTDTPERVWTWKTDYGHRISLKQQQDPDNFSFSSSRCLILIFRRTNN